MSEPPPVERQLPGGEEELEIPGYAARVCPYSRDTAVACPFYEPVSEHGSGANAADCRYVIVSHNGKHVRTLVCARASAARSSGERESSAPR